MAISGCSGRPLADLGYGCALHFFFFFNIVYEKMHCFWNMIDVC